MRLRWARKSHRLADFVLFGEAVSQARGMAPGVFLGQFTQSVQDAAEEIVSEHIVGVAMMKLAESGRAFDGQLSDLLNKLRRYSEDDREFPKTPRKLGSDLKRLAPDLERCGIMLKARKSNGSIRWRVWRKGDEPTGEAGASPLGNTVVDGSARFKSQGARAVPNPSIQKYIDRLQ